MTARADFPKYQGGVVADAARSVDEYLLVIAGLDPASWRNADRSAPISRAHDTVETNVLTQEELNSAVRAYDHQAAMGYLKGSYRTVPPWAADLRAMEERLMKAIEVNRQ